MQKCGLELTELKAYKEIELNEEKNLTFFLEKHSTKEGTWGHLTVHKGQIDFNFLDGAEKVISSHQLNTTNNTLLIPPACWHNIASTSSEFSATLRFLSKPHRYFEKKYGFTPVHHDLLNIYQMYFHETQDMKILDIGSGSGRNAMFFALLGHKVTCLDNNQDAIQKMSHITQKEKLTNLTIKTHDLNETLTLDKQEFDLVISTNSLQFLNNNRVKPLLTALQSMTKTKGTHILVFPIKSTCFNYPKSFTYLADTNEIYQFYQDCGWSVIEYTENNGLLKKLDENGRPLQGVFGLLVAQKG
jgi:tellurite methyltransferase